MSCQNIIERIQPGTVTDFHYSFFISPRLGSTDFLCKFLPRVRGVTVTVRTQRPRTQTQSPSWLTLSPLRCYMATTILPASNYRLVSYGCNNIAFSFLLLGVRGFFPAIFGYVGNVSFFFLFYEFRFLLETRADIIYECWLTKRGSGGSDRIRVKIGCQSRCLALVISIFHILWTAGMSWPITWAGCAPLSWLLAPVIVIVIE